MTDDSNDTGTIQALIQRLETRRLPRALAIKAKVDSGDLLGDLDIEFLERVFSDARHIQTLADRHPEWQSFVARVLTLYHEITERALANEKAGGAG